MIPSSCLERPAQPDTERRLIRVAGVVQGVGYRPFVFGLARSLQLAGNVRNEATGVTIDVQGPPAALDQFTAQLVSSAPPAAVVDRVTVERLVARECAGFSIEASHAGSASASSALVSPDLATCADCLRELRDPIDRRFGYPFINCTNCGPRYTIVTRVPYDRPNTTMCRFEMCAQCQAEYLDPGDRRFHAQPVACPGCGPRLSVSIDAIADALNGGAIVALKGIGGYHLAADAANEAAVRRLRERKRRERRPFALMVRDRAAAGVLVELNDVAAARLLSAARPIVVLSRRGGEVAESVAPGCSELGVMLAYAPLHHLLFDRLSAPLVMTSGNVSAEPIAYEDAEASRRLGEIADLIVTHDRPIQTRVDDSVERLFDGRAYPLRRARGHAPAPVRLPRPVRTPVLAVGGQLKNTICAARGGEAFLSHHVGDLSNLAAFRSFEQAIAHVRDLFSIEPAVVAHDLHPDYLSTTWAHDCGLPTVAVQHHHAHVVSCLVDNGELGPAIGVAFDGLGYGPDGTLWGGEFLVADAHGFVRAGHLAPVPMPGGAAAIRQPWRMAAAHWSNLQADVEPTVAGRHGARWAKVVALAQRGVNAPLTSSVGRLFDAVASLLGVRDDIDYEGQAAIELEQLSERDHRDSYPTELSDGAVLIWSSAAIVREVLSDAARGVPLARIGARFHNTLAEGTAQTCEAIRQRSGLDTVALSGGVFQNVLLLRRTVDALRERGFRVLTHQHVPPNDGGISLGQAVIAAELA